MQDGKQYKPKRSMADRTGQGLALVVMLSVSAIVVALAVLAVSEIWKHI